MKHWHVGLRHFGRYAPLFFSTEVTQVVSAGGPSGSGAVLRFGDQGFQLVEWLQAVLVDCIQVAGDDDDDDDDDDADADDDDDDDDIAVKYYSSILKFISLFKS